MTKKETSPFATIGYTDAQLDRREQILEAKRRREEMRANTARLNQWAWAFTA